MPPIELHVIDKKAYTFNADDWYTLRREFRIVGSFCGSTPHSDIALPVVYSPEETALVVSKNIAILVKYEDLHKPPPDNAAQAREEELSQLLQHEQLVYNKNRRETVETYIDKIIEGKRAKGTLNEDATREEVLEQEVQNTVMKLTRDTMIVPIEVEHPKELRGNPTLVDLEEVLLDDELRNTRIAVYENLWGRGYYITNGYKFGGDFLVYFGDPLVCHSQYIIRCLSEDKAQDLTEYVAFGRLAKSVKKIAAFATLDKKDCVRYISVTWSEI